MPGKRSTRQRIIRKADGIITRLNTLNDDMLDLANEYDNTSGQTLASGILTAQQGLELAIDLMLMLREQM